MKRIKSPSSTSNFKVGQIVEYNGTSILAAKKGSKAIVTAVHYGYLQVKWINTPEQSNGDYLPTRFNILIMAPQEKIKFLHKNKLISNLEYLEALSEK